LVAIRAGTTFENWSITYFEVLSYLPPGTPQLPS
jgi:hypothetical protein